MTTQGMVKRQTRPVPEVAKTEAEAQAQAAGAFGDWDIRREPTTRNVPDETQFESIEKEILIHSAIQKQTMVQKTMEMN